MKIWRFENIHYYHLFMSTKYLHMTALHFDRQAQKKQKVLHPHSSSGRVCVCE